MQRWETIEKIVKDICVLRGDPEYTTFRQIFVAAGRVIHDLDFFNLPFSIRTEKLTLSEDLTINYPTDASVILTVGVCVSDKKFRLMGRKDSSDMPKCNCEVNETCDVCYFHGYYGEGYSYKPDGFANGYYIPDDHARKIKFTSGYDVIAGNDILVKFKSMDEDYQVIPKEAFKVIHFGVQDLLGEQNGYFRMKGEVVKLRRIYQTYTLDEIINAVRGHAPMKL